MLTSCFDRVARLATYKALQASHMQQLSERHWCCYIDGSGIDPDAPIPQQMRSETSNGGDVDDKPCVLPRVSSFSFLSQASSDIGLPTEEAIRMSIEDADIIKPSQSNQMLEAYVAESLAIPSSDVSRRDLQQSISDTSATTAAIDFTTNEDCKQQEPLASQTSVTDPHAGEVAPGDVAPGEMDPDEVAQVWQKPLEEVSSAQENLTHVIPPIDSNDDGYYFKEDIDLDLIHAHKVAHEASRLHAHEASQSQLRRSSRLSTSKVKF